MSLIEQALRRIQEPIIPKVEAPPSPPTIGQSQQQKHAAAHSWPSIPTTDTASHPPFPARPGHSLNIVAAVVIGLSVLSVIVVGGVVWMRRAPSTSHPSQTSEAHTIRAAQTPGRSPQASLQSVAQGDLVLSGIVEGLGEPYAVINGMILVVGDQIGDETLLEIGNGMVRLRRADGSDTVLRAPR